MFEHIRQEQRDGIDVLSLRGQFVGGEETDALRELLRSSAEKENARVVVDLAHVTYLNSTALGVLISSQQHFTKHNAKIVLCNLSKSIENIFVITKLTLVFEIHQTLDEAIKSFTN